MKRWKKAFYANKNKKKSRTMISRAGILDLKTKTVIKDQKKKKKKGITKNDKVIKSTR